MGFLSLRWRVRSEAKRASDREWHRINATHVAAKKKAARAEARAIRLVTRLPPGEGHRFGPQMACYTCGAAWHLRRDAWKVDPAAAEPCPNPEETIDGLVRFLRRD